MGQKIFIPISDELLFDHPELISEPLRPYTEDLPCFHWLEVKVSPITMDCEEEQIMAA